MENLKYIFLDLGNNNQIYSLHTFEDYNENLNNNSYDSIYELYGNLQNLETKFTLFSITKLNKDKKNILNINNRFIWSFLKFYFFECKIPNPVYKIFLENLKNKIDSIDKDQLNIINTCNEDTCCIVRIVNFVLWIILFE